MISSNVKISVITASWNSADTLSDCLKSVAQQTYFNFEHVIVDGASTDSTLEIVKQHISKGLILKTEIDEGIYDALNKGINLASGEIIGFLHADDLYASEYVLEKIAKVFSDPAVLAVYGDLEYVNRKDTSKVVRRWKSSPFKNSSLIWGWMPPHPTLYVRREWYERVGFFDKNFRIAADYLSILQFFANSEFKSVYIPEVLVKMRLGGASNDSFRSILIKTKEDWSVLRKCGFNIFNTARALFWKNLRKVGQFFNY